MDYLNQFIALADGFKMLVLGVLIGANLLTGIAVSIRTKSFRLKQVGDFLISKVLPYIICYFAVCFITVIEPSWQAAVTVVWGIILAALVGAILTNLKEVGINLPDILGGPPAQ